MGNTTTDNKLIHFTSASAVAAA